MGAMIAAVMIAQIGNRGATPAEDGSPNENPRRTTRTGGPMLADGGLR